MKRFLIVGVIVLMVLFIFGMLAKLQEDKAWKAATTPPPGQSGPAVDIDFTRMNPTIETTFIYKLLASPKDYAGKTMRLSGMMLTRVDENDGKRYFACQLGSSGCSCCSPGVLEFVPKESYAWPKDFPSPESMAILTGRLEMHEVMYEGRKYTLPHLVDTDIAKAE